jgi:hypothetical protein
LEASLDYRLSSKPAWTAWRDPVLTNKQTEDFRLLSVDVAFWQKK